MAHDLFQNKMVHVGVVPWHRPGSSVPAHVSAAEMIEAANLDWMQIRKNLSGMDPKQLAE